MTTSIPQNAANEGTSDEYAPGKRRNLALDSGQSATRATELYTYRNKSGGCLNIKKSGGYHTNR